VALPDNLDQGSTMAKPKFEDSPATLKARLTWVKMYHKTGDAGLTCRRCGISRPTLRKWYHRFQEEGEDGLKSRSRRRKNLPPHKLSPLQEQEILELRKKRRLGPKRLQSELFRLKTLHLSTSTIWHILKRHDVSATLRPSKRIRGPKRYNLEIPGQRVQIDSCKIGKGLWQFTAIDDCTRMRVLGLYPDHQATRAVDFVKERVLKEFPFPIQRIQTDRGSEFMADDFQKLLRESKVKFRPNRPRCPHLNGKVERSQQTDKIELWSGVDLSLGRESLAREQRAWQSYYNEERVHSALERRTPKQKLESVREKIPSLEWVQQQFDPGKEKHRSNSRYTWVWTGKPPT
jgi:transposase InsO family protein